MAGRFTVPPAHDDLPPPPFPRDPRIIRRAAGSDDSAARVWSAAFVASMAHSGQPSLAIATAEAALRAFITLLDSEV